MTARHLLAGLIFTGVSAAMTAHAEGKQVDTGHEEDMARAAIAQLHGTQGNEDARAIIRFEPSNEGLRYKIKAKGLKPGKHAYHLHFYGNCTADDAKSAGTHFNLKGSSHNPPKGIDRITGDLGDLNVGKDGQAKDQGVLKNGMLDGPKSIIGRSVIIHEKANDYSQPPIGAAGGRDACGVIGIDQGSDDKPRSDEDTKHEEREKASTQQ